MFCYINEYFSLQHEKEFCLFLAAAKGNIGEKRLASQFICRFFKYFQNAQEDAVSVLFELCEDPDASVSIMCHCHLRSVN